jgi:hypothetical protein
LQQSSLKNHWESRARAERRPVGCMRGLGVTPDAASGLGGVECGGMRGSQSHLGRCGSRSRRETVRWFAEPQGKVIGAGAGRGHGQAEALLVAGERSEAPERDRASCRGHFGSDAATAGAPRHLGRSPSREVLQAGPRSRGWWCARRDCRGWPGNPLGIRRCSGLILASMSLGSLPGVEPPAVHRIETEWAESNDNDACLPLESCRNFGPICRKTALIRFGLES